MYKHRGIMLVGLAAAVALSAFVAVASARRLALSNQFFRVVWTGLQFEGRLGIPISCPVTIEGSFHSRTLSKVLEQLIGYVTRAIFGAPAACTGGSLVALTANLPWHIRYNGFSGTLPRITEIHLRFVLWEFLLNQNTILGRVSCLYRSTAAAPLEGWIDLEATNGAATGFVPNAAAGIPLLTRLPESQVTCPATFVFNETSGTITLLGNTTKITVTLVA